MTERRNPGGMIILPEPTIIPVRMNADAQYEAVSLDAINEPAMDDQAVIKMYLHGLIARDCQAMSKAEYDRWAATPTGQAEIAHRKELQAARERGDLMMVSLSDRREDGFSLRYLEVDREGLRRLQAAGYVFDANTTAWANENRDPGDEDRA